MAAEQLNQLAAGNLDQRGQEFAATILTERITRLNNTVTALSKQQGGA